MYAAGDDAEDILNVLPLTDAQKKSYKSVTEAFNAHVSASGTSSLKEHTSIVGIKNQVRV